MRSTDIWQVPYMKQTDKADTVTVYMMKPTDIADTVHEINRHGRHNA